MRRISVIGSSGAGKTTLSRVLAKAIGGTHIELDALYHGPNWTPTADNEFRRRVGALVENECWVIDGNYSTVRDLVWSAADTVVWIDLPRRTILPSLLRRTLTRMWRGTALWNGNRERFRQLLDPRAEENVLLWMWTTHRAARQMYSAALAGKPAARALGDDYALAGPLGQRTGRCRDEGLRRSRHVLRPRPLLRAVPRGLRRG